LLVGGLLYICCIAGCLCAAMRSLGIPASEISNTWNTLQTLNGNLGTSDGGGAQTEPTLYPPTIPTNEYATSSATNANNNVNNDDVESLVIASGYAANDFGGGVRISPKPSASGTGPVT
jgi:hypothetical protein